MSKKLLGFVIFMFTLFTITPALYAAETRVTNQSNFVSLTLQQAIDLGLKNSKTIKKAAYNIERGEEVQKAADLKVQYIPVSPSTSPTSDAYYTSAVAASINARMAVRDKTVEEDKVILSVLDKYTGLQNAMEERDYAYISFKNSQLQLNNSRISFHYGMISSSQLKTVEAGYNASKSGLAKAELQLLEAYRAFNEVVGFTVDSKPVLTESLTYNVMEINNPETEVSRILSECPTVWSTEQAAKLTNLQLSLHSPIDIEPYEAKVIDVKKAELAASDVKEQMRGLIRLLYNSVKQYEEAYISLNEQVSMASEQLRVKQIMFENGMATKYDVQTAELELAKAQKSLKSTINKHEYLKLAFQKPWAYISSER